MDINTYNVPNNHKQNNISMKNIFLIIISLLTFTPIYTQQELLQILSGDSVILKVENTNPVQWEISLNTTNWAAIPNATLNTYRFLPSQDAYYRAAINNMNCGTVYSDTVYIPVLVKQKSTLGAIELSQLLSACYVGQYYWHTKDIATTFSEGGTDIYTYGYDNMQSEFIKYGPADKSMQALGGLWNNLYKSVINCNALIHYAGISDLTNEEKKQYIAEARFLRAYYFWQIVETWGGTVFIRGFEPIKPSDWKIAPVDTFYNQIFEDLLFAKNNLPASTSSNTQLSVSIAEAFMARLYLTHGNYNQALQCAQNIFASNKYNLIANLNQVWDMNNRQNTEVIYGLDFTGNDLSTLYFDHVAYDFQYIRTYNGNNAHLWWGMRYETRPGLTRSIDYGRPLMRFMPTRFFIELFNDTLDKRFEGSFRTAWLANNSFSIPKWPINIYINNIATPVDAAKIGNYRFELGDTAFILVKNYKKTKAYLNSTQKAGDAIHPDKGYSILDINDIYNPDGTPTQFNNRSTCFTIIKKFEDKTRLYIQDPVGTRNAYIIRLAEIYLIAAEASLKLGQTIEAYNYLLALANARAINGNGGELLASYGINNGSDITIDFILDERARELAGEQLRWFDLKRTGKLVERVSLHNRDGATNIKNFHTLRPIPIEYLQPEFKSAVVQNPGYL
jgi:hypothetical protein